MPFDFAWAVKDDASYNDYSHKASSDGKITTGTYTVVLPDGRTQTVNYKDEGYGYVADVQYAGEAKYADYKPAYKAAYAAPAYVAPAYPKPAYSAYPAYPAYKPAYPVYSAYPKYSAPATEAPAPATEAPAPVEAAPVEAAPVEAAPVEAVEETTEVSA